MAGINSSLKLQEREPLILRRHEAYIGVLIDDLITKGTNEPYRMFTSRAEYRLLLRHDNADLRLMDKGHEIGILDKVAYQKFLEKKRLINEELQRIKKTRIKSAAGSPTHPSPSLTLPETDRNETLEQLLKRPEITYEFIEERSPSDKPLTKEIKKQVEIQVKYDGYIQRQMEMAEKLKRVEEKRIPENFNYGIVNGLSKEIQGKLKEIRPANLGQASRIPGITPAAVSLLLVTIEKLKRERGQKKMGS
jgi:tRNA uridine 5-carboxymethylaminomethyl modification enzyme